MNFEYYNPTRLVFGALQTGYRLIDTAAAYLNETAEGNHVNPTMCIEKT